MLLIPALAIVGLVYTYRIPTVRMIVNRLLNRPFLYLTVTQTRLYRTPSGGSAYDLIPSRDLQRRLVFMLRQSYPEVDIMAQVILATKDDVHAIHETLQPNTLVVQHHRLNNRDVDLVCGNVLSSINHRPW